MAAKGDYVCLLHRERKIARKLELSKGGHEKDIMKRI